jgi:hypothetical protein
MGGLGRRTAGRVYACQDIIQLSDLGWPAKVTGLITYTRNTICEPCLCKYTMPMNYDVDSCLCYHVGCSDLVASPCS